MPRCCENQSWILSSAVFVAAVALQQKCLLFEKSWEHAKDVGQYTCFIDFGKVYGRVPREKLWGMLWQHGVGGLTGADCWLSNHRIPVQKIVSVSTELTHDRSALVLDSDSGVCCHHSSS